jgi:uncharacterized protein YjlB
MVSVPILLCSQQKALIINEETVTNALYHKYLRLKTEQFFTINNKSEYKQLPTCVFNFHHAGVATIILLVHVERQANTDAAAELKDAVVQLGGVVVLLQHFHHHLLVVSADVIIFQATSNK